MNLNVENIHIFIFDSFVLKPIKKLGCFFFRKLSGDDFFNFCNGWMDPCPGIETDGGKNQRSLVFRLVIVYSGAIGAIDSHTLSSINVETSTNTFRALWDANSGRTSPYQQ